MKQFIALTAGVLFVAGCNSHNTTTQTSSAVARPQAIAIDTTFSPNPPKKGAETLTVTLKDAAGAALKGATVKINTTMPSMSMSGPSAMAKDNGDGSYTARLTLKYATRWQFAISANAAGKKGISQVIADVK